MAPRRALLFTAVVSLMNRLGRSAFAATLISAIADPAMAAGANPNPDNMSFTGAVSVLCGSEATARQQFYEYDHGLPTTTMGDAVRTPDGAKCVLNLATLLHPRVSLIVRHGAFCNIRIHDPKLEQYNFWILCVAIQYND